MIEISFGKLLLLAVIALIVLGPEKLPMAARTAGTLLRRLRSGWDSVRAEVERELQVEEIRRAAREAAAQAEAAQAKLDQVQSRVDEAARKAGQVAAGDVSTLADAPAPAAPAPADDPPLMTGKPKDATSAAPQDPHDEVPRGQG
ncbi:MAG TPA: Sec-independent protein translocase protein TatB [Dyella sp.]|nr:Sec-independent protein translocase protein TatB [Dyella sp.]